MHVTLLLMQTYRIPNKTPRFLGYTINDFNLSHGRPQMGFGAFMQRISNEVCSNLVPELTNSGMILDHALYEKSYLNMVSKSHSIEHYSDYYCLAQVSNFNKLIAMSHEKSIPIFELKLYKAHEGQAKTLNWFKLLFKIMAERVEELTSNE